MKLGFIGAGAMASAIARGLRQSGDSSSTIVLYDVNGAAAQALADSVSGTVASSAQQVAQTADLVILAVKPHIQTAVLAELASDANAQGPALISIAAGRTLESIAADLRAAGATELPPLCRVMPNVAAQVGASTSALCYTPATPERVRTATKQVFDCVGATLELPESHFAAFTAMASSSPAWFFEIAESLARAGVKYGLTKAQALAAVTQSMLGSALLLKQGADLGESPSQLVDRVSSPGGTTIAGLLAAQESGLQNSLVKAVDATVRRFEELDQ